MGCGISKFERRHQQDGDLTTTASEINHPQPQVVDSEEGEKEKESSPSLSWPRFGGGGGLEGIKIKEDADHNNHDDDDEQGDDSFINYPRSPSFREYCTDSELPFGDDSSPDNDGDDIDSHGTNRKIISKSTMSTSPKTQYDKAVQSGSKGKGELAAKTEYCHGRSGLKMKNVLSNSNHRWRPAAGEAEAEASKNKTLRPVDTLRPQLTAWPI